MFPTQEAVEAAYGASAFDFPAEIRAAYRVDEPLIRASERARVAAKLREMDDGRDGWGATAADMIEAMT